SGRNGGFCCIGGSKLDYEEMRRKFGEEETRQFFEIQKQSVNYVANLLAENQIEADVTEPGELCFAHSAKARTALLEEQNFLNNAFDAGIEYREVDELNETGFTSANSHGASFNPVGFGLHPLKYTRGLAKAADKAGVRILENTRLLSWQHDGKGIVVKTENLTINTSQIVFATNGYTPENVIPALKGKTLPAMSSIMTTRPLTEDELDSQGWTRQMLAFDSRILLHYFRLLPDNRILLGGRGGTDPTDRALPELQKKIRTAFEEFFPQLTHVETSHFWRGFVCLSRNLTPYIGALDEVNKIWTCLAYHGNGVALGSWSGQALAHQIAGKSPDMRLPRILTGKMGKFPLPMLRRHYLKAAYLHYGLKDRFS
ncbi:MAG: FAD-binding oxidoreductase, partial [Alphaproteobacteria bacterium]|nr:FAD-binding oxidoreductase [Alphaproteobacteria bacterium]